MLALAGVAALLVSACGGDDDDDGGDATTTTIGSTVTLAPTTTRATTTTTVPGTTTLPPLELVTEGATVVVANASGPIDPHPAAAAFAGFPTPGNADPDSTVQQATNTVRWLLSTGNSNAFNGSFETWVDRVVRGNNFDFLYPYDYEMRFTGSSLAALDGIFGQSGTNPTVPFELWNVGIGTPDDPSDDVRMIPVLLDIDGNGEWNLNTTDSPQSSQDDDPVTDWVYWYSPVDESPGEAGYLAFENGGTPDLSEINHEVLGRVTLVGWNIGLDPAAWSASRPEDGTVFRIRTANPFNVSEEEDAPAGALSVSVSPNPSRGAATVAFALPSSAEARVSVLDVLGREVAVLADGPQAAGPHQTRLPRDLAAGVYVVVVETGAERATRTVTVVR